MSILENADKSYITLTPAGVFEAFSQREPSAMQLSLQALLSHHETMLISKWLQEYPEMWLESFDEQGFIEKLTTFLPAPDLPLDQFLPYVVASLSGKRRAAIWWER